MVLMLFLLFGVRWQGRLDIEQRAAHHGQRGRGDNNRSQVIVVLVLVVTAPTVAKAILTLSSLLSVGMVI